MGGRTVRAALLMATMLGPLAAVRAQDGSVPTEAYWVRNSQTDVNSGFSANGAAVSG